MSSRIDLTLTPSHAVGGLAALPWLLLTAFIVATAIIQWPWLLPFLPVSLFLGWRDYQRLGLLQHPTAVTGLTVSDDTLYCRFSDGRQQPVAIGSTSGFGASILALKLRPPGTMSERISTIILSDIGPIRANTSADALRQMKVWLRTGPLPTCQ